MIHEQPKDAPSSSAPSKDAAALAERLEDLVKIGDLRRFPGQLLLADATVSKIIRALRSIPAPPDPTQDEREALRYLLLRAPVLDDGWIENAVSEIVARGFRLVGERTENDDQRRAAAREASPLPKVVYRYQQAGDVLGYFQHKPAVDEPLWLTDREKRLVAEAWGLGRMTMYADRELCRSCFGVGGKSPGELCPTCHGDGTLSKAAQDAPESAALSAGAAPRTDARTSSPDATARTEEAEER